MTNYLCEYLRDLLKKQEDAVDTCNSCMNACIEPMRRAVEANDAQKELFNKIKNLKYTINEQYRKEEGA